jgi:hypothetical protein
MKKRKKNGRDRYLWQRNNRWKWMAGATAATAAGVSTSQGSLVTINLANNYIFGGGNHLNPDLTGDGHPDLAITGALYSKGPNATGSGYYYIVRVKLNGVYASAGWDAYNLIGRDRLGSKTLFQSLATTYPPALVGSIPIFFKDLHINGGAPTSGSLEVSVSAGTVQLDSFTYTSNSAVAGSRVATIPDQGSSLALLAMGAGGVLALRRWRTSQRQS